MAAVQRKTRTWASLVESTETAIAVANAADSTLLTITTRGTKRLCVEVSNTGANAFSAFKVQAVFNTDGDTLTLFSASADYLTPKGILVGASGDLTLLAAGVKGWLILDTTGIETVKLVAQGAGATTANVYAGGGAL